MFIVARTFPTLFFYCLLLDSDSASYWNICRIYSDFADKKSLMFIGKIVDRMDTYLPTSHLQSMKTALKLNTWLVWKEKKTYIWSKFIQENYCQPININDFLSAKSEYILQILQYETLIESSSEHSWEIG
jgi:hypothetical protein